MVKRGKNRINQNHGRRGNGFKKRSEKGKVFRGIISINSRGVGFVSVSGIKEDVRIEPEWTNTALHGDEVEITIKHRGREISGAIVKIVNRAKTKFVGTVDSKDGGIFVIPDNRRIHVDFKLEPEDQARVKPNLKVLISLIAWEDSKQDPRVRLEKIIGEKGDNEVEMAAIALESGFESEYPSEAAEEAAKAAETAKAAIEMEARNRRDFRKIPTFTIDPKDAKDFDDAISYRILPDDTAEIGVHIADVSHFVKPGGALDREALRRATSVYLVDRTIPMLPDALSNDICSLKENEDRLTFSAVFKVIKEGKRFRITDRSFGKSIIRSAKRFTYENAFEVLEKGEGLFAKELKALNEFADFLRQEKFKAGAIDFDQQEVKIELDSAGRPIRVFKKERLATHLLVEELMLLANREVAEFIYRKEKETGRRAPFLYRIHDLPKEEQIGELALFVKALGFELPMGPKKVRGKDIAALLERLRGHASEALVRTAAVRTMAKAIYSTKNIGHFGLAFPYYTHFTSPIRRYPDLIVHRLLFAYLENRHPSGDEIGRLERDAVHASRREIDAAEAERQSIKMKQVEFMQSRIGNTFDGIVSGVTDWGLYVEEDETKAEGMIRIKDIGDDYYTLDQKNYRLVGEKTKRKFTLGDKIKIKLTGANPEQKTLEFRLV